MNQEINDSAFSIKKPVYHAGFVGLIGWPNAGKSTLVNTLIGEKVSIVTAKPQTTRQKILGILNEELSQTIFVDAPGKTSSSSGINQFLEAEFKSVMENSDALISVLHLDHGRWEDLLRIPKMCAESGKPWMVVITKSDFPQPHRLILLREKLQVYRVPVVAVSALKEPETTREIVIPLVRSLLPVAPGLLYDQDLYTNQTLREMVSEIVREKSFEFLHQEIPYGLAVRMRKFQESESSMAKIYADLMVNKEGHRPIVIGKGGSQLKQIGQAARQEIEKLLGKKVYLELRVVVKKNWVKDSLMLQELGYVSSRK